ncbi:mycothiol conjugate amidase Mca [Compostimonas suwonensis]|uniref:Mycothiol S-conjugate amidase n=1 Tax=Compostimonas suwonensis TaxID=1048394 RepID=A0A2M9BW88_9MICO|nr:mycothiol conjugate amidase Mca [Compostimonas suwonensis]PJJ62211.1 mycothiol S-conjugate amidase [Compostimonas suwonensis]
MTLRLLAVHAHPDDESSKGAATYAYYRSRGASVMVVSCTGGEGGDILNPAVDAVAMAHRDLPGLRRREMAAAQAVLGIEHHWLGYVDSGMAREDGTLPANSFAAIPLEISTAPLVNLVRDYRPHVLVTYDENGGYPHPDHIRCHQVSVEAFRAAADPTRYPDAGEPWQISKLYYDRILNAQKATAVHAMLSERMPGSPLVERLEEIASWMSERPQTATTRVPVGEFFEARDAALRSHASQVAPDSEFFFWPNELQREAWPYEDFELVESSVQTSMPESDLFAGIEDEA